MAYVIVRETTWGYEYTETVKGTQSLEKYTDSRIVAIHGAKAKAIYKVYADSRCVQLA